MFLLTEADVEVLRKVIADYRTARQPRNSQVDPLHRASDVVRVKVETTIPARTGNPDPVPTHEVEVWDIVADVAAGYTIKITEQPDVSTGPGMHYAAIDRKGIWSIIEGAALNWFKLVEDAEGEYGPAWARRTDRVGAVNGELFQLYWWDSIISGAKPGYKGLWSVIAGENVLVSGPCPDYCFSEGSIDDSSLAPGTVGTPYVGSVTASSDTTATGLPPGLAIDSSGNITGTPTEASEFCPAVQTTADKTGPAPATGTCTITKVFPITINPEE